MQSKNCHKRICKTFVNSSGLGLHSPGLILITHPDLLHDIQQIVQGIGSVPELMLLPHPGGHGQKQKLVNVRAGQGAVSAGAVSALDCPPPKKPDRLQAMPSSRSFMQVGVSCSSSGYPHSLPVMTG